MSTVVQKIRRRRGGTGASGGSLTWRADQLEEALETGGDQLDPAAARSAREVVERVRERWALKGGRTVVSLAGATGSGKSTLFNALVGESVSTVGARRPTTSTATAAVWGTEDPGPLLDWLAVPRRHQVSEPVSSPGQGASEAVDLDGLVLIDLPDFDSRETSHRVEADRLLARSDVFVWVTDPQKYADARLHEEYLATLQDHETVMIVVLNQIDRVEDSAAVYKIKQDLARLVAADGAGDFEVIGTSARTLRGVDRLREAIGAVVAQRNAAEHRLRGDLSSAARALAAGVAPTEPASSDIADDKLRQALSQAAGIPTVLGAVHKDYRRRSTAHTGWPFTRWLSGLRPDPLRRLRLGDDRPGTAGAAPSDVGAVLGRSSLPPATPAARSAVELATRRVGEQAGEGLPLRWAEAVEDAATPDDSALTDALDQAVLSTSLRARDPFWWSALRFVQLLFALTAVAGLLWLVALAVVGWLQIDLEVAYWGPLPVPAVLLVGGLLAGLLVAALGRMLGRAGAARRRALVADRMETSVDGVVEAQITAPVAAVLQRHRETRQHLESAQA